MAADLAMVGEAAGAAGPSSPDTATPDRPATLVLGLGNILLSDEGVGVRAVEALVEQVQLPPDVEVLDGGTSGMDLLDQIAGRAHLIVVDAVKTGRSPASVVRLAGDDVPAFFSSRISPHQLGLSDVLAVLRLMDAAPQSVTVIGVEPVCLDLSLELSPAVAVRLPDVIALIRAEMARVEGPLDPFEARDNAVEPSGKR